MSAPAELLRALAVLAEPPDAGHERIAETLGLGAPPGGAAYAELFLFQFHPYASVYVGAEGMLGGEARDRVAGFWRAVGRTPPAEADHLSALLGLLAALQDEAADATSPEDALIRQSATALMHEHLVPWVFAYLDRVGEAGPGFYRHWAALATEVLTSALVASGDVTELPVHLREAPPLPDPRVDGGASFAAALVAPVRSGMILTRADLGRLGHSLGLGLRLGERRFILEHLLAQDAPAVLSALGDEAGQAAVRHAARRPLLGAVADFWEARASTASGLLHALAQEGEVALTAAGEASR